MKKPGASSAERRAGKRLSGVVMLFYASAFLLLALRDNAWQGYALAVGVPAMIWLGTNLLPHFFPADRLLLTLTNFLCALGILVLYRTQPELAYAQVIFYGIGIGAMALCTWAVRLLPFGRRMVTLLALVSLFLLVLPLVAGTEKYGAKNWIYIGGVSFQPSELVKLSLLVVLASGLAARRFWSWLIFALACLGLLMLQKDLGTALLYYAVTLLLAYAATGSWTLLLGGLGGSAGAAWLGYRMFSHVKRRVAVWQNPWADYENAGYQMVQALMALASGGLFGMGLGLGTPKAIPVFETDFIFSVICEQFGLIFGLCVLLIYVALVWRGATVAMAARRSFHGLLAMGATLMIGLQTFVIIGGVIKLIPLTGVTLPFISSGGSSMISGMCLTGLIQGVASRNEDALAEDADLAYMQGEVRE
ncbi:MAG: FtsW/RodA/SpoVE family cell cycle protein [Clostridia bacterium]|nr:FtsW/RodA/SpoVE family cell cycle protein [Clostridia bacterium]